MTGPAEQWSAEKRDGRALLKQGVRAAVNLRRNGNLIAWAKERGLFVRVMSYFCPPCARPIPDGHRRKH